MDNSYIEIIQLLGRIHRQFMDVISKELGRLKINNINNVQSLMLLNIGDARMSIGDLTARGIYLGSNVAYNVKKMVDNGYLNRENSTDDRRVSFISLTEKGRQLCGELIRADQQRIERLSDLIPDRDEIQVTASLLLRLDHLWTVLAHRSQRGDTRLLDN
jgi:DNA-binding MarR family transcriptional regulator